MNLSAFKDLTITDLGDLDSCNPIEISRILFYLLDQNIIPIVFACPKEIIDTIAKYQENRLEPFSLSLISNFINKIDLDSITKSLFLKKVHLIAIQRHYTKKKSCLILRIKYLLCTCLNTENQIPLLNHLQEIPNTFSLI